MDKIRKQSTTKPKISKKDNRKKIPQNVITRLWVRSAGRCEYDGCNEILWRDDLTTREVNAGFKAHIIDVNQKTHRYDPVRSPQLATEYSNLMLLCHKHHQMIDNEEEEGHTVEILQNMKEKHETWIELLSSVQKENKSHVVFYGANIGDQSPTHRFQRAAWAMIPERYPADSTPIVLSLTNSSIKDDDSRFWTNAVEELRNNFADNISRRLKTGSISHLSIFAIAPIPLLMELGRLLSDIHATDAYGNLDFETYQLHREPPDWKWQDDPAVFEFSLSEPKNPQQEKVALNLSLSGDISNNRITSIIGEDTAIWKISIPSPNNDFMKSKDQLSQFRECMRSLFAKLGSLYDAETVIHIFPAIPVSVAVDFGRVWMPKVDLPLKIYDQNYKRNGFVPTLNFNRENK